MHSKSSKQRDYERARDCGIRKPCGTHIKAACDWQKEKRERGAIIDTSKI